MDFYIQSISDQIFHIAAAENAPQAQSYTVLPENLQLPWKVCPNGAKEIAGIRMQLSPDGRGITFQTGPDSHYYGLGQQQEGTFDYRGKKLKLKHTNTTIAMPLVLTNCGFGIFWDNPGTTEADFTDHSSFTLRNAEGNLADFYILKAETIKEQLSLYWHLTGPAVLLPKYAFGFWQSKMRYTTQQELLDVAKKYREKGYPLDIIVVDFYHWTKMGDFQFDPACWPAPEEMFAQLKEMDVQCMVSMWPCVVEDSRNFAGFDAAAAFVRQDDGKTNHFTIFNGDMAGLYDPFRPEARNLYWHQAKGYFDQGATIGWMDSCEPDDGLNIDDFKGTGINTAHGPLDERINAYALEHCRGVYEGQRADFPRRRVLTLARSAFSGCQRYGVTVWSGDIGYDYEALRKQITAGLSAAMSGLPFWTTDIGGFTGGDPNNEDYRQLYVRWFQYGAFCPMLRVHGSRGVVCFEDLIVGRSRGENELWSFGPDAERMMGKFLKLRYRLLPYIYSAAYETARDGIPMMRPLVMEFGKDCEGIEDQYMFGPALLVCPVLETNARSRRVYLPSGTDWYDFETHERYAGGQWIMADAPLDKIPVFVKAGSILPLCDQPLRSTLDNWGSVTLQVFSGADGAARIYCDDGVSYDYEQGKACVVHLSWDDATRQLSTTIEGDPAFALKVSQVQILS